MPGTFIDVAVEESVMADAELAAKLTEVCPVDIFSVEDDRLVIVEENLDECVLCDLCLAVVPGGTLEVVRLYES